MWNHGPGMEEMMQGKGVKRPTFSGDELIDLISYLESVSPPPIGGPLYILPGNSEEGRVVFFERGCVDCHSVQGVGGRIGPDLAKKDRQWGLTEFAAAMWNKAPAMTAAMMERDVDVPQLGAGEMADLVAYFYSVQYFTEPGDPASGRQLLSTKSCLTCHSLDGQGGTTAPDLAVSDGIESPADVIAQMWSHAALMEAAGTTVLTWPTLTPEEMADIAAFVQAPRQNGR
jgi:mono/diheme cytochrome c family protein